MKTTLIYAAEHTSKSIKYHSGMKIMKSNTLDEGTMAFMQWLNSKQKYSSSNIDNNNDTIINPIILKQFCKGKYAVLVDSVIGDTPLPKEIIVEIKDGVPLCSYCKSNDCAHVG